MQSKTPISLNMPDSSSQLENASKGNGTLRMPSKFTELMFRLDISKIHPDRKTNYQLLRWLGQGEDDPWNAIGYSKGGMMKSEILTSHTVSGEKEIRSTVGSGKGEPRH